MAEIIGTKTIETGHRAGEATTETRQVIWQIKFKSGAGQQIYGFKDEAAARKWIADFWGADYEILSVEAIQPPRD